MTGRKRLWQVSAVVIVSVSLGACGTPDAVKHLSTAQTDNLNAATVAVRVQGKAVIALAQQVKKEHEAKIESLYKAVITRYEGVAAKGFPNATNKEAAAKEAFSKVIEAEKTRTAAINQLNSQFEIIKDKSNEVIVYIEKLKDAQMVLDGYLQSQRLGDALLGEAMDVPLVGQAINALNTLQQEVTDGADELNDLVDTWSRRVE